MVVMAVILVGLHSAGGGAVGASGVQGLPPAKATIIARQNQAMATAQAQHPVKTGGYNPPPAVPTATLTAGIFQTHQGPFSNSTFSVEDMYRGPVGSQWEVVFAGTAWTNFPSSGVGALRVYSLTGGLIGVFVAPDHSIYIEITGISETTLQLKSDKSATLSFNLATNTFGE